MYTFKLVILDHDMDGVKYQDDHIHSDPDNDPAKAMTNCMEKLGYSTHVVNDTYGIITGYLNDPDGYEIFIFQRI